MSFRTAYGYTHSENGWRMCNRDECDTVRIPELYFVDTAPLRKGPPHTILGAWMYWYDRHVEEILSPVWGWSNTNDVANSNHLSGTAIDINAPKYPWGQRVMPAARIKKIREGLALFEGTIFWGADWSRADEMHFQMAFPEGDRRSDAFAAKLRAGHLGIWATPPKPSTEGTLMALSDKEQRELLDRVRLISDQLGPKHPSWGEQSSFGRDREGRELTMRDGLIARLNQIAAKVGVK